MRCLKSGDAKWVQHTLALQWIINVQYEVQTGYLA
jgi:hypothetical protein